MLQRSIWSHLILSAATSAACLLSSVARAQDAAPPAPPTPAAAPAPAAADAPAGPVIPADKKLVALADDFLHYSLINNVELAKANGQALLNSSQKPEDLLRAFEDASGSRNFRDVFIQNQRRPDLQDVSAKLLDKVDEGARALARDPVRIRAEVERLAGGPRAYANAKDRLAAAGQFAAPVFLEYLQNATKGELHPYVIRVMGEIGRPLLNPLIEELRVSDPTLRIEIVNIIGQIGYPQALPALRALQADDKVSGETKAAIDNAIATIDHSGQAAKMTPAELYLRGAQNYYDKKASYQPLLADEKSNPVWIFDAGLNNVTPVQVPTAIWNSVMALRMAEATLRIDGNNADAISLWLAANSRRELQLPQGATDPTRPADARPASFYLEAAGPMYVNPVLAKALDVHDSALALQAIDALEATGGVSGLVTGADSPLVRALANPNRSVRFRAAFALARANPPSQFPSFFRVVPILAEAVSSTGSPSVLLVVSDDDMRNAMTDVLRNGDQHFAVYAGSSLSSALEQARRAPAFDVVIVPDGSELSHVTEIGRSDYRLTGVPVLVTSPAAQVADVQARIAEMKGYKAINDKSDAAAISAAITQARAEVGSVSVSPETASQFSAKALDLLGTLAADHRSIYSVADAVPALIDALKDKRPEIVTAAARDLGELNNADAERALAAAAMAADTDAALRVIFYEQLAESAKRTGNSLDASIINGIIKTVSTDADPKVRQASAKALGALNVPSNQASVLILQQAK